MQFPVTTECWLLGELENVAISNALQLEAARRRAVPIRFNFVARAKFEVAHAAYISCRLRAFLLLIRYFTVWPWTLIPWPWPLTFDLEQFYSEPAEPWSNSVWNLSEIGQSAAELLQFEYLTFWPWTLSRVALCSGIVCTKFTLSQAMSSWNITIFWC